MISFLSRIAHQIFHYYSSSCLHRRHDYCNNETGVVGAKIPASCKFCGAGCRCKCHGRR